MKPQAQNLAIIQLLNERNWQRVPGVSSRGRKVQIAFGMQIFVEFVISCVEVPFVSRSTPTHALPNVASAEQASAKLLLPSQGQVDFD